MAVKNPTCTLLSGLPATNVANDYRNGHPRRHCPQTERKEPTLESSRRRRHHQQRPQDDHQRPTDRPQVFRGTQRTALVGNILEKMMAGKVRKRGRIHANSAPFRVGNLNCFRRYCALTKLLRNVPIFSITTSNTSPSFSSTGGLRKTPTPSGVPVAMTSPGSSVIAWVM